MSQRLGIGSVKIISVPCGGTHLDNTKYIGKVKVKRKNLGRKGQRVSMVYETDNLFQEYYR